MSRSYAASNGIYVAFRSRYRSTTYFDMFVPRGQCREIGKHDDGRLTVGEFRDEVTEDERQAMAEFEANEAREFAEWQERNQHLFV